MQAARLCTRVVSHVSQRLVCSRPIIPVAQQLISTVRQVATTSRSRAGTPPTSSTEKAGPLQNEAIPHQTVIVITSDNENLGPKSLRQALALRDSGKFDLKLVNTKVDPPICRLIPSNLNKPSSKPASIDSEPGAKVYKNEKIPHLFVSVVAEDGSDLGLKSVTEALKLFDRRTHDLVLLSKTNGPPSCRIMSHEAQKQAKADAKGPKKAKSGKSAKNNITKELEIGTAISQHDLDIKMAKATQFLEEGCKVQLTITKKPVGSVDAVLKQVETILKPVSLPPQPAPPQGRKQIVLFLPKASRK